VRGYEGSRSFSPPPEANRGLALPYTHTEPADSLRLKLDHPVPGCAVVEVTGDIDLVTAPQLFTALHSALGARSLTVLFVDLTRVEFLAAAGVSALLDVRRRAERQGVELRLVTNQHAVLRPLALLGLSELFDVRPSVSTVSDTVRGTVSGTMSGTTRTSTVPGSWSADATDGERGEKTRRGDETGEQVGLLERLGDHGVSDHREDAARRDGRDERHRRW
jgi:anti-sigma B factor antagonist